MAKTRAERLTEEKDKLRLHVAADLDTLGCINTADVIDVFTRTKEVAHTETTRLRNTVESLGWDPASKDPNDESISFKLSQGTVIKLDIEACVDLVNKYRSRLAFDEFVSTIVPAEGQARLAAISAAFKKLGWNVDDETTITSSRFSYNRFGYRYDEMVTARLRWDDEASSWSRVRNEIRTAVEKCKPHVLVEATIATSQINDELYPRMSSYASRKSAVAMAYAIMEADRLFADAEAAGLLKPIQAKLTVTKDIYGIATIKVEKK